MTKNINKTPLLMRKTLVGYFICTVLSTDEQLSVYCTYILWVDFANQAC